MVPFIVLESEIHAFVEMQPDGVELHHRAQLSSNQGGLIQTIESRPHLLREAPLLSGVLNLKCPFFVRSSFVRKIIDFCEGEMEGPRIDLPTGSLTHRFLGVQKVDPPKLALATGIGRFRDPFFGRKKVTFLEKSSKSGHGILPGGKGAKITLY